MKTIRDGKNFQTHIAEADHHALMRVIKGLGQFVEVEPLGGYATMTLNEIWLTLVEQVCVMGKAEYLDRLKADPKKYGDFKQIVAFSVVRSRQNPQRYLSKALRKFRATRFHNKGAEKLITVLRSPDVFQDGKVSLLESLSDKNDVFKTRYELMRRCPIFRLKSASDFMISVGLSHDVIALDIRIVGLFQKYFHYNLTPGQVQANAKRYLSLETTLRRFCQEQHISLAFLDRLLFTFTNVSAIELMIKYPEFKR